MHPKVKCTPLSEISTLSSIPEETLRLALDEYRNVDLLSLARQAVNKQELPQDALTEAEKGGFISHLTNKKLLRRHSEMLDSLSVGGFKAYAEDQKIGLAPITLIFGPNSSGKSSFLHSFLLGNEMVTNGNIDVDSPILSKGQVKLGGPERFVNGFKLRLGFSFKLADGSEVEYRFIDTTEGHRKVTDKNGNVELKGKIVERNNSGFLDYCEPADYFKFKELEPQNYFEITLKGVILFFFGMETGVMEVNTDHPFIQKLSKSSKLSRSSQKSFKESFCEHVTCDGYLVKINPKKSKSLSPILNQLQILTEECNACIIRLYQNIKYIGPFREPSSTAWIEELTDDPESKFQGIQKDWFNVDKVNQSLEKLNIPYKCSIETCRSIITKNDERIKEMKNEINDEWNWDSKEKLISNKIEEITDYISSTLSTKNSKGNLHELLKEISVDLKEIASLSVENERDLIFHGFNWLFENSLKTTKVFLESNCSDNSKKFTYGDVGFGISQVIPIVLNSLFLKNHTILIEQPELHIHPAIQTELGDLFIQSARGKNHNRLILETHSEHLILRLLRRIRQTTENDPEYPSDLPKVKPEDVAVYYAEKTHQGTKLHRLRISPDGDFLDRWPKGFFTERRNELFR